MGKKSPELAKKRPKGTRGPGGDGTPVVVENWISTVANTYSRAIWNESVAGWWKCGFLVWVELNGSTE